MAGASFVGFWDPNQHPLTSAVGPKFDGEAKVRSSQNEVFEGFRGPRYWCFCLWLVRRYTKAKAKITGICGVLVCVV